MKLSRWFLPDNPDVLGMLVDQARVSVEGMEALVRWASGDTDGADACRDAEHRADDHKQELRLALRSSLLTPLDAEDLYALSERLDAALNQAKDTVREAEVMAMLPGKAEHRMAELLAEGHPAAAHRLRGPGPGRRGSGVDARAPEGDRRRRRCGQVPAQARAGVPVVDAGSDRRGGPSGAHRPP